MSLVFPEKWKDTVDVFSLKFDRLKIKEVLGYPHAANQVFAVKGIVDNEENVFIVKYKGHVDSNIKNEIDVLKKLSFKNIPKVVEHSEDFSFSVTEYIEGDRLSVIVGNNEKFQSMEYMFEFGEMLAKIHKTKGVFNNAPHRNFHEIPSYDFCKEKGVEFVYDYLVKNKPTKVNHCFVHGDFHYANLLWKNHHISGVLDFELAGIGNKEYDIAWSIILRPSQKFMKTKEERELFLKGYKSVGECDEKLVHYYMVLILARFIKNGDKEYKDFVTEWLKSAISVKI